MLNPDQVAELLADHEAMCWWVAKRVGAGLSDQDREDIAAEVRANFLEAARTFDPSLGCTFGSYALRFGWKHAVRFTRRLRARGLKVPSGYPAVAPEVMSEADGPEHGLHPNLLPGAAGEPAIEAEDFWAGIGRLLLPREREVVALVYRDGLSVSQVAARGGWGHRNNVYRILGSALERLRGCAELAELAGVA